MKKTLTKHGNSLALIIDKPILKILGINEKTNLEISIENGRIVIQPKTSKSRQLKEAEIDIIAKSIMKKYAPVFKKLSKT